MRDRQVRQSSYGSSGVTEKRTRFGYIDWSDVCGILVAGFGSEVPWKG